MSYNTPSLCSCSPKRDIAASYVSTTTNVARRTIRHAIHILSIFVIYLFLKSIYTFVWLLLMLVICRHKLKQLRK